MSENTERFTGRVEEYARFRARYPVEEILGFLRETCGLTPEWRVADVGAGTGMLTEVFLTERNPVVAVEPNAEMRAECALLEERWPKLRIVNGTAESTGLPGESVEMVAAGRAFHWFEPMGAAREFRRVLVPGGWVVLVSHGPRLGSDDQAREMMAMQRRFETRPGYVGSRGARAEEAVAFLEGLGGGDVRQTQFVAERRLGWEAFAGFLQSLSCTPMPGDAGYEPMRREAEAFFARWSEGDEVVLSEVCYVNAGRV